MFEHYFVNLGPSVVAGAVFVAVAWACAHWGAKAVTRLLRKRVNIDPSVAALMTRVLSTSLLVLAGIAVLEELGIEVASLIAALGIFGFAIAIGLRTTSTNFFTGVMLFVLKPYWIGDYIEGERVEGIVESMSLFHTVVITKDGVYVAVPNAAMWARSVRNFSRSRPRCIEVDITVERGTPFGHLQKLIYDTLMAEALVSNVLEPLITIVDVKANTMTIRAAFWCDAEHEREGRKRVSDASRASLTSAGAVVRRIAAARKKAPKKMTDKPASAPPADEEG